MAITPSEDKDAFWKRIRYDPWMEKSFNLVGKTDAFAATKIRKNRTVDDTELTGDVRYALIYDIISDAILSPYELSCIEVDILAPSAAQDWADSKLSQVIALCGVGWSVNGKSVERVTRTGELTSAAGFYKCGARFYYSSYTRNKILTI